MLQKVEPAERGIPKFREVYISDIRVTAARKALSASDIKESLLENFVLKDINIQAKTAGEMSIAKDGKFQNFTIQTEDNSQKKVINSTGIDL